MRIVILHDSLRDAINRRLDIELERVPDAASDRDALFDMLLEYYDEHGQIPDFTLEKRATDA